ncbi:MAG: hypothetical protein L3J71_05980 [Victivallaceae bacterium]|nr:hypothetical protein [Victivallaceae bacterium]
MIKRYKKRYFSLLELIVVIAIIMLVAGITVSQVGRLPSFASLENNAFQVKALFIAAGLRATSTGTAQTITYSTTSHTFTLDEMTVDDEAMPNKIIEFSLTNGAQATFYAINDSTIPAAETGNPGDATFTCFPDGLISGPDIELKLRKHRLKMHISPLTGAIRIIQPDSDGEYKL